MTTTTKVAYSYIRFSDVAQADGDSVRRQSALPTEKWCQRNGYTLDSTPLIDRGRSARHGRNFKGKGKLGQFLALVRSGVVKPGSALILENLDRFSRQNVDASVQLAREIIMAGVDLVTLVPEYRYTKEGLEKDAITYILLTIHFQRAHDESDRKALLSSENWSQKRKRLQERQAVTPLCPFWLDCVQDGEVVRGKGKLDLSRPVEWRLNGKVAILRTMFDMADNGHGSKAISAHLVKHGLRINRAAVATNATVVRILKDTQVLGIYTPRHRRDDKDRRQEAGAPVEGYYPAVIGEEQFARVQESLKRRSKRPVGRGRKGENRTNLFSDLLYCARNGGRYYIRSSRGVPLLTSAAAMQHVEGAVWIDYDYNLFERSLLGACRELPADFLRPETPAADMLKKLEQEHGDLTAKMKRVQDKLDNAKDEAEEEVYGAQLVRLTARRKELEAGLSQAKADASMQPEDKLAKAQGILNTLDGTAPEELYNVRSVLAVLLQGLINRIEIYVQRKGKTRRYIKRAWVWVFFANGKRRKLYIDPCGAVVSCAHDEDEPVGSMERVVPVGDGWE